MDRSGRPPAPLDGGITNRNYRARFGDRDYVIRVPGKDTGLLGIDREAEAIANRAAAAVGVAPPVAAILTDPPVLRHRVPRGPRPRARELRRAETLADIAAALRAVHGLEATAHDLVLAVPGRRGLRGDRAASAAATIPDRYDEAHARARAGSRRALTGPSTSPFRATTTCWPRTSSASASASTIVDWEYAGMGDRYFDLANFAVNNELGEGGEESLLGAYFGAAADRGAS